jgi:ketosteroid isomerase-like protein
MTWSRVPLCFVLATGACTRAAPALQFTAADERAVRALDSAYVAAWLRDDTTGVMNTLAPDAVLMPAGQRILATPGAIRAFWWPSDSSHTRILTFDRTIDEVGGEANVAWMRGTDSLAFTYAKGATTSRLTSRSMALAVLRRQGDGSWRISRMMWGALK